MILAITTKGEIVGYWLCLIAPVRGEDDGMWQWHEGPPNQPTLDRFGISL